MLICILLGLICRETFVETGIRKPWSLNYETGSESRKLCNHGYDNNNLVISLNSLARVWQPDKFNEMV